MLIRCRGHHDGAQEYLEEGKKNGRDLHRDELDHRLVLDGDLDLTRSIYQNIQSEGERYYSITLSFKEDDVDVETLKGVSDAYKSFIFSAFSSEEVNFYAEAHLPKVKSEIDRKTGEVIERKPHIHIIIPKVNLLSGNIIEPLGYPFSKSVSYQEAIQEKINRHFGLASPRDNLRQKNVDYSDIISRHKGDDFRGKNKAVKQEIYTAIVSNNITDRAAFYQLVEKYGETRIRNPGKENEYLAVKLPGDAKFTNLNTPHFSDAFITRRESFRAPLSNNEIERRLIEWPLRAKEIKYVDRAGEAFRKQYYSAGDAEKRALLADRENQFYRGYEHEKRQHFSASEVRHGGIESGTADSRRDTAAQITHRLHGLSAGSLDGHASRASLLLQNDFRLHVGEQQANGDPGLRRAVRESGRGTAWRRAAGADAGGGSRHLYGYAGPANGRLTADRPAEVQRGFRGQILSAGDLDKRSHRLNAPARTPVKGATISVSDMASAMSVSTVAASLARQRRDEKAFNRASPDIKTFKTAIYPGRLLKWLEENKGLDIQPHSFFRQKTGEWRIKDGSHNHSLPDFLQKKMNMSWPESRQLLSRLAIEQQAGQRKQRAHTVTTSQSDKQAFREWLPQRNASVRAEIKSSRAQFTRSLRQHSSDLFERKAEVRQDPRLSREDKQQISTILTFECLKKQSQLRAEYQSQQQVLHQAFKTPWSQLIQEFRLHQQESTMSSKTIRERLNMTSSNTISSGAPDAEAVRTESLRNWLKLSNIQQRQEQERETDKADNEKVNEILRKLGKEDFFTQSKNGGKVQFIEKASGEPHFTDAGKKIEVYRSALKEGSVDIALDLAVARFGSTLRINGSSEFKEQVIQAAADKNMDVHFTDKAMEARLAEVRQNKMQETPSAAKARTKAEPKANAKARTTAGPKATAKARTAAEPKAAAKTKTAVEPKTTAKTNAKAESKITTTANTKATKVEPQVISASPPLSAYADQAAATVQAEVEYSRLSAGDDAIAAVNVSQDAAQMARDDVLAGPPLSPAVNKAGTSAAKLSRVSQVVDKAEATYSNVTEAEPENKPAADFGMD